MAVRIPVAVVPTPAAEAAADVIRAAVVLALVSAGLGVARAAPCRATAVLGGDGELVTQVGEALARRGIATSETANCPSALARLEQRDRAVVVTVTDPDGRRSERTFADVEATAALIESWARQDLNASALLGFAPAAASEPGAVTAMLAAPPPHERLAIAAAFETSVAFAGTTWLGARASACVRVGPLCAGATTRFLANGDHHSTDVLAGVELPIALGARAWLVPGVAAGGGWFQVPFATDPMTTTSTVLSFRGDAHLALAVVLAPHVALVAGVALGLSPSGPTVLRTGDAPITNDEPTGFFRAGVGVEAGIP